MSRGQYLGHWQYSTEQDVVLAPHRTSILVGKTIYFTDKLFKKSKSGWRKKQQCSRSEVVLPPRRRYLSRDLNGRKAEILQGSFPGRAAHALGQEHAWCILEIARHLCSWSKLCDEWSRQWCSTGSRKADHPGFMGHVQWSGCERQLLDIFKKKPDSILVKIKPGHTCVFFQVVKGPKYFKYG